MLLKEFAWSTLIRNVLHKNIDDVPQKRGPGAQSILKVFIVVEVMAVHRPLKFFHSSFGKACLHGSRFVYRGVVKLEQVWTPQFQ